MNILYIITQADGGGAQKYVLTLAKHFNGAIAAGNEAHKLFDEANKFSLATYELKHLKRNINFYHDLLAIWEIRRLVKFLKPTIVHLNSTKAGILGSFACIGLKTKVVFTAHGFRFLEPLPAAAKNFYLALEKTASSYRDYIITVSDADKNAALTNKIIDAKKVETIHNGISEINFLPQNEARSILDIFENKIIVGTVANLYKTKGLDVLINASKELKADLKNKILFIILGDGPERKNLEAQIASLGLTQTVKLLGHSVHIPKAIKAFDIFILPSRKEGFPYTLLEAMQAGLPIIATDVGGNKEALGDAAILIEQEKETEIVSALNKLINDKNLQNQLSQKALERSKIFTENKMIAETENIYKKISQ